MNPAAEARAKVKADHPEAVVVGRERNSLKHRIDDAPDGRQRFVLDVAIGPLHYGPDNNLEIDTALQPSVAPWDWEMTKAGFEVWALSDLSAGQVIEYRKGSEWVRFQPHALQYSNALDQIQPIATPQSVAASVADDTLTWTDGYGLGLDFSWQVQTARLMKLLTVNALNDLPTVDQFILDGGNPVLELNLIFAFSNGVEPFVNGQPWGKGQNVGDRDTQGLVEFRDSDGNILWWFNLPRSWDSERNEQLGTFRFKKQGNSLFVTHRVPLSFVQSAIYPLMVDTTIDEQVGAGADDGRHRVTSHFWSNGIGTELIGNIADSIKGHSVWTRFTTVNVGQANTIDVAYLTFNPQVTQSGATCVGVIDADDSDDAAQPADHTAYDAISRTTANVDWNPIPTWTVDTPINTPSIVSVVQEIVDRGSWAANNAMLYILHDNAEASSTGARRVCDSYDGDTSLAPKLHIEFTVAGGETRSLAGSQPAAIGTLTRIEQGLRAIVGSQPASAGVLTRVEQALRALTGSQPASSGTLVRAEQALRAVAGDQPSASGTLTYRRTRALTGNQPTSTGTLARIEQALRTLIGSQLTATGILVRVLSAFRALEGNQPAPSGILTRVEQAIRALSGSQPAATGTLAAEKTTNTRAIAGDQPTSTGTLTRIEKALRALAGNQPTPIGILVRKEQALRTFVGNQPASSGALSAQKVTVRSVTGNQPASSATLARFAQMGRLLSGSQFAAVGVLIRIEQALRAISGDQPASAATLTGIKPTALARLLVGNQPSATGTLRTITAVPIAVTLILNSGTLTIVLKDATLSTKLYSGSLSLTKKSRD